LVNSAQDSLRMSTTILSSATADTVLTDKMATTTNANFDINVLPDATDPWLTDKFSLGASAPRKLDLDQRASPGSTRSWA
jgi:hypothetical protein